MCVWQTDRLLVDEPGEIGGGVGLPRGAQRLQGLAYLVLLLDTRYPRLLVRQVCTQKNSSKFIVNNFQKWDFGWLLSESFLFGSPPGEASIEPRFFTMQLLFFKNIDIG